MYKEIDPGRLQKPIDVWDDIVYRRATDFNGNKVDLKLTIMDEEENPRPVVESPYYKDKKKDYWKRPVIVWVPGDGYRQDNNKDKDLGRTEYFVRQGFVVVSVQYRSTAKAIWPAQVQDILAAIRWIRKNAEQYQMDSDHIGIMGRSAGSHLASMVAMNDDKYRTKNDEYHEYSSKVQACIDLFGPVDIQALITHTKKIIGPNNRWHKLADSHEGALLGHDPDKNPDEEWSRAYEASPTSHISNKTAPMLIMHGELDPLVPLNVSKDFYKRLCDAGLADQTDFYILKKAGHGTPEYFQDSTMQIMSDFFIKYLGKPQK